MSSWISRLGVAAMVFGNVEIGLGLFLHDFHREQIGYDLLIVGLLVLADGDRRKSYK